MSITVPTAPSAGAMIVGTMILSTPPASAQESRFRAEDSTRLSAIAPAWSHAARSPARVATIDTRSEPSPPPLAWPAIVIDQLPGGAPIEWMAQTTPVTLGDSVFALAFVDGLETLVAADAPDGTILWTAGLPFTEAGSWASPAVDAAARSVVVAMGQEVIAFGARTGRERWRTDLGSSIVNASPLVTDDLGPADRVFVADYGYTADAGRLWCLNADRYDVVLNPYQPGEVVWSVVIDPATSGNSPAYADGVVFVATADNGAGHGRVLAFDATATAATAPIWGFTNPVAAGFFGGVSTRDGAVYASTYAFAGGQLNSSLVKLDAATGALDWAASSNRSASTPIPLADGRVVLSAGIAPDPVFGDFGSRPSVQVFSPAGALLLDTALDTWEDLNHDGLLDPGEYTALGGWTHQPVAVEHPGGRVDLITALASPDGTTPDPGLGLAIIDLGWRITDPPEALVRESTTLGAGPADASGGRLISLTPSALTIRSSAWNRAGAE